MFAPCVPGIVLRAFYGQPPLTLTVHPWSVRAYFTGEELPLGALGWLIQCDDNR